MYEQDYIMRIIANLIKFLSKVILGKDIAIYELSEAENLLFEEINPKDNRQMMVAIDFYQRLNNLDNEFLQQNNFSRKEIKEGLEDISKKAGIITYKV